MNSPGHTSTSPEQVHRNALLSATGLGALALYITAKQVAAHPVLAVLALTGLTALCAMALTARARIRDRLAAREDPPPRGIIIGSRRGDWRLARPRPYTLGWDCFAQHVLITGPTGRGKSFGFIQPILRGHIHRAAVGVLYVDGKGDRIDQGPDAVRFDHVFCPQDPGASACWNPLGGPDPIAAAQSFADALFPAARLPNPVYYEVRGAFAIRAVAPAIAVTAPAVTSTAADEESLVAELTARGVDAETAQSLASNHPIHCVDQLRWLKTRDRQDADSLIDNIRRDNAPKARVLAAEEQAAAGPRQVTVAELHHVLFTDGQLAELADTLEGWREPDATEIERERVKLLASQVRSLATLPAKERAGVLSNLENRLAVFLSPPFDQLCARSDFSLADVCGGASIAMLLPTGSFAGIAEPLGRVALAQFQQAVLASDTPTTKLAVLDEFHNFVSPGFTKFLAQARSRGGAAVMSTQSIADFDVEYRDQMLANASTQIITPGALPFDAEHWSRAFGEHAAIQRSETRAPRSVLEPAPPPSIRTEVRDQPRYTPTAVTELKPSEALIRQVCGRRAYPAVIVDVERHGA